jgi:hypothetical protein
MGRVNYVAKAKALMAKSARTTALVIMPLAAAASARAGTVSLPTGNFSCETASTAQGGGEPCSGGDVQLTDPGNGLAGLKMYTSGAQLLVISGSSGSLDLTASGVVTGSSGSSFSGSVPVSYDFTLGLPSGGEIESWFLNIYINGYGLFGASGSGSGTFTGSGSIALSGSLVVGASVGEQVYLQVQGSPDAYQVSFDVPPDSVDYNPSASVAAPEPASLGLIGTGLAFLSGFLRRRRRIS